MSPTDRVRNFIKLIARQTLCAAPGVSLRCLYWGLGNAFGLLRLAQFFFLFHHSVAMISYAWVPDCRPTCCQLSSMHTRATCLRQFHPPVCLPLFCSIWTVRNKYLKPRHRHYLMTGHPFPSLLCTLCTITCQQPCPFLILWILPCASTKKVVDTCGKDEQAMANDSNSAIHLEWHTRNLCAVSASQTTDSGFLLNN